jgi:hypothetical protein
VADKGGFNGLAERKGRKICGDLNDKVSVVGVSGSPFSDLSVPSHLESCSPRPPHIPAVTGAQNYSKTGR